ncbi:hypothetical protein [Burkholderia ubonensis]|uniref:hypothetical protein n=1 Tax=Burkholderia ubonensis TaxID=101571 RepID=UPI0012FAC833|nr:hypothetical protein [Burkholderia ubonensis]
MKITLSQHCRKTIYRAAWDLPEGSVGVYLHAEDRGSALKVLSNILDFISVDKLRFLDVGSLHSCRELIDMGVSDDPDMRIFEISHEGQRVTQWVERPLFLSADQSLIGKWIVLSVDRVMLSVAKLK